MGEKKTDTRLRRKHWKLRTSEQSLLHKWFSEFHSYQCEMLVEQSRLRKLTAQSHPKQSTFPGHDEITGLKFVYVFITF